MRPSSRCEAKSSPVRRDTARRGAVSLHRNPAARKCLTASRPRRKPERRSRARSPARKRQLVSKPRTAASSTMAPLTRSTAPVESRFSNSWERRSARCTLPRFIAASYHVSTIPPRAPVKVEVEGHPEIVTFVGPLQLPLPSDARRSIPGAISPSTGRSASIPWQHPGAEPTVMWQSYQR